MQPLLAVEAVEWLAVMAVMALSAAAAAADMEELGDLFLRGRKMLMAVDAAAHSSLVVRELNRAAAVAAVPT